MHEIGFWYILCELGVVPSYGLPIQTDYYVLDAILHVSLAFDVTDKVHIGTISPAQV